MTRDDASARLADLIDTELERRPKTPQEIAAHTGLELSAVAAVLQEDRSPTIDEAEAICSALGFSMEIGAPEKTGDVVPIDGTVTWRVTRHRNESVWIAVTDDMSLTIEGVTWPELLTDIGETVQAVLHDLADSGDLGQYAEKRGWAIRGQAKPGSRFDISIRIHEVTA